MFIKKLITLLLLSILVTPIAFSAEKVECHIRSTKEFSWIWSTKTTLHYFVEGTEELNGYEYELSDEYLHEWAAQRQLNKLIKNGVCPEMQPAQ